MREEAANLFNWRLPLYGSIGAVISLLPMIVFGKDIGPLLLTCTIGPTVGLVLLVIFLRKIRRDSTAALSMLAVFVAASGLLFKVSDDVRTTARWLLHSHSYKDLVIAQPTSITGELKHTEWDGWGFPGAGATMVYLVFDPNDSLAAAAKNRCRGKYSGIPCEVLKVRRLESKWYTVLFYTDTDWNHCA